MKPTARRHESDPSPHPTRSIVEEYERLATAYDRRWAGYSQRSVAATLAHTPLAPGSRLLDVGCGTGVLLGSVQHRAPHVRTTGVDLTAGMVRQAARRLRDGTCLAVADAAALPFADGRFDVVVSTSSAHFWTDLDEGLAECHRVLAPGGHVVITDWCADYWSCALYDRWCRWRSGRPSRVLRLVELHRALTRSGFTAESSERHRATWWWGMMTMRARKPASS